MYLVTIMNIEVVKCEDFLKNLKCSICKELLSVPPILTSNVGNICGRCPPPSNTTFERNVAYEIVAKRLLFPCKNYKNGCMKIKLPFNQVLPHENACKLVDLAKPEKVNKIENVTICPFMQLQEYVIDCPWKGLFSEVQNHLLTDHSDGIIGSAIKINRTKTNIQSYLMRVNENVFVICLRYLAPLKLLTCAVMIAASTPHNLFFQYQVELVNEGISFMKNEVELLQKPNLIFDNPQKVIIINLSNFDPILKNPNSISCKFTITKKTITRKDQDEILQSKKLLQSSATKPDVKQGNNLCTGREKPIEANTTKAVQLLSSKDVALLEELNCPICNEYMKPPIFICTTGHSICDSCKKLIKSCPLCKGNISDTRNFTLEKLTAKVHYPCKFRNLGCQVVDILNSIQKHESLCSFIFKPCPLKCGTKITFAKFPEHFKGFHNNQMMFNNKPSTFNIQPKKIQVFYVILFDNQMFFFGIKYNSKMAPIKFNIQYFGPDNEANDYRFELQFIDQSKKGLKFIISQVVKSMNNIDLLLKDGLSIDVSLLSPFVKENTLHYQVSLYKVK